MTDKIVAFTTCERREDANRIARGLVERKLAACVNILPKVTSIYRWEDKVEETSEWMLLIKTTSSQFENLKLELPGIHPYEVPELIGIPILDGSEPYLAWVDENLPAATPQDDPHDVA